MNQFPSKNYFTLPNEIFSLGLSAGEIAVYAYLRCLENPSTYQCWPSYATSGKAVGRAKNTVMRYVDALLEKGLISTEPTSVLLVIRQNRRNVSPRLGGNTPQADPQGRGAGAYQVPRPATYVRDPCTPKRRGCQNRQQYARPLRRGLHPPHLHPRYKADAAKGRGENGQFHGTDPISPTGKQSTGKETISSPVLFGSFRIFRCTHGA